MYINEAVLKALCHCGRSVAKTRNPLIVSIRFSGGWRVKPAMTGFQDNHRLSVASRYAWLNASVLARKKKQKV